MQRGVRAKLARVPQELVIRPGGLWSSVLPGALWDFRELAYFFAWRDVKLRYRQTVLGVAWALLQPVSIGVVFAIVLGRLANLPSDGIPYPLFVFLGFVPWVFFSQSLSQGARSLSAGSQLISRVYFPRLLLPIGAILSLLVDLAITCAAALVLVAAYGYTPDATILALPLFLVLLLVVSLGGSFLLAAVTAQYRDVRYGMSLVVQLWLFATPVVYPLTLVPAEWRLLTALNPMVAVVEGFRWTLVGGPAPSPGVLAVSVAAALALLAAGTLVFALVARRAADVL